MKLSPAILRAAYAMLDECEPFSRWNLPAAEDVNFVVGKTKRDYACCTYTADHKFILMASAPYHGRLPTLLESMAHEMIHVHIFRHPRMGRGGHHNAAWHRYADQVCKSLGFDRSRF